MSSAGFSPETPSGKPAPDTSEAFSKPLLGQFSVPKPGNRAPAKFGEEVPATTPGGEGGDTFRNFGPRAQYFVQVPEKAPGCDI